jgi:hypothetical protein
VIWCSNNPFGRSHVLAVTDLALDLAGFESPTISSADLLPFPVKRNCLFLDRSGNASTNEASYVAPLSPQDVLHLLYSPTASVATSPKNFVRYRCLIISFTVAAVSLAALHGTVKPRGPCCLLQVKLIQKSPGCYEYLRLGGFTGPREPKVTLASGLVPSRCAKTTDDICRCKRSRIKQNIKPLEGSHQ